MPRIILFEDLDDTSSTSDDSMDSDNIVYSLQVESLAESSVIESIAMQNHAAAANISVVELTSTALQESTTTAVASASTAQPISDEERKSIIENIQSELLAIEELTREVQDGSWESIYLFLVNITLSTVPAILNVQVQEIAPIFIEVLPRDSTLFSALYKINKNLLHDDVGSRNFVLLCMNHYVQFPNMTEVEKRKTLRVIQRKNCHKLINFRGNNANKYKNIIMCVAYTYNVSHVHYDCRVMGILLLETLRFEIDDQVQMEGPIVTISESLSEIILSVAMLNGELMRRKLKTNLKAFYFYLIDQLTLVMGLNVKSYAYLMWSCDIFAYGKTEIHQYYMDMIEGVGNNYQLLEKRRSHHFHYVAALRSNNQAAFIADDPLPRHPTQVDNIRSAFPQNFIEF